MGRLLIVVCAFVAACSGGDNNEPNNTTSTNNTANNTTTTNNTANNTTTTNNTTSTNTGIPDGSCCCQFIVEGDIIEEDLLDTEVCTMERDRGECITVDPGRLTPHPCCPNATGERCGDG